MEEEVVISKEELRKLIKEKRLHLEAKETKDKLIMEKLINHPKIRASQNILIYISKNYEVDTFNIIKAILKMGKQVYAPRVVSKSLQFYRLNKLEDLKLGKFNIWEPTSQDLFLNDNKSCIIVPGLSFDSFNNRLGYGGGYYDRFLEGLSIYKIGVCYQEFLAFKLETSKYDIKMDEVITERN